jgi:hypothetical protein
MRPEHRELCARSLRPSLEGLEDRRLPSTVLPDVAVVSATTADSKEVTVDYTIGNVPVAQSLHLGIYRSASNQFDGSAVPVGAIDLVPMGQTGTSLDAAGQPALAVGPHQLTIPLPAGLPPVPKQPFVLVVADPQGNVAESDRSNNTAAFETHTIAIVTHGGVQPKSWAKAGPPWERRMAADLKAQGYDAVIAYNWVAQSNHAGSAALQAPRLAALILQAATQFPPSDPIDVHFIGHSEGTVVNSQTILLLDQKGWPPAMKAGYLEVTMLDPHAANNAFAGQQYSVSSGPLGFLAKEEINAFQSNAKDPPVIVPANVDRAEVFYQHTPVAKTYGSNGGIYNLWGQVPVIGAASYFDLTAPGISHSGKFGVQDWYRLNVVPTLGSGDAYITSSVLTASLVSETASNARPGRTAVTYAGTAAPHAVVRLFAARTGAEPSHRLGVTRADSDGSWQITSFPLPAGTYRISAASHVTGGRTGRPNPMKPVVWLRPVVLS